MKEDLLVGQAINAPRFAADQLPAASKSDPLDDDWAARGHMRTLVLMAATVAGMYLCYRMLAPFMPALVAALTLAVLFTPLQRWLEGKLKSSGLAAAVSVLLIALIVVAPITFVTQRLAMQAIKGVAIVEGKVESGEWRRALQAQPRLAPLFEQAEKEFDLPTAVRGGGAVLSRAAGNIVRGSVFQIIGLCIAFYLLFFFLRDRNFALKGMRSLSPLAPADMSHMLHRIGDTIHATVYGTLLVAAVQGLLGGLMFWWLGLAAPFLWGVIMALLAVVPVLGSFVVWLPAALFLASEGSYGKALILVLWGALVIGTIDNLLRPVLVGKRLKLHTVPAFISVVGGLIVFGAVGLILGPVILTITIVLLEIWSRRRGDELATAPK